MKILVIDNFDSFTFNLVHYLEEFCSIVSVVRYDKLDLDNIKNYDKVLISPGPGHINDYPKLFKLLDIYKYNKSILGVCLGHQLIANYFGYEVKQLDEVLHGKKTTLNILKNDLLFKSISNQIKVGHYHSWYVEKKKNCSLIITSRNSKNIIMSIRHKKLNIFGVQFHPESIMTDCGKKILKNWIHIN